MWDDMITREDVEHISWLASIKIEEEEKDELVEQFNSILEYFHQLDLVDTEGVEPTYRVVDLANIFREDVARGSLTQDEALINAPATRKWLLQEPKDSVTMLSELKATLRAGSAEEYLSRLYERIEKGKLNAFTTLAKETALQEAKRFDKDKIQGNGLLAGVPIAIKECISTKGIESNCSSRILQGYIPPYDAHVIERLKAEGAIIMGKTNMDEFAMGTSTETSAFGPTRNPWDHRLRSGRLQRRKRGLRCWGRGSLLPGLGYGRFSALSGVILRDRRPEAHLRPGLALWTDRLCQLLRADRSSDPYRKGHCTPPGDHRRP